MTGSPAAQNANIEEGNAHAPVTDIRDPDPGAPATQLNDNHAMAGAFEGSCVESVRGALQPRLAPILPSEVAPGREAPRKPHPGDRRP